MADAKLTALTETSVPALDDVGYQVDVSDTTDDAAGSSRKLTNSRLLGLLNRVADGRLTLTSGTPVTTADVTGATNIYYTPYTGQCISIYDGTRWRLYTFTELTLALGTLTSGLPYDVFIYDNSGTLTLESLAWTNGTTRATALALTNGVYLKTGALTRRYLGTFYTTSTTETEDSAGGTTTQVGGKRFLWNMHNRVLRPLSVFDGTDNWSYGTATWRVANGATAPLNCLQYVTGLADTLVAARIVSAVLPDTASDHGQFAIGLGNTTPVGKYAGGYMNMTGALISPTMAFYTGRPGLGYRDIRWLEKATGGTLIFYGDNAGDYDTGMMAEIEG